ncbi:MAG: M55 family metallopeptidase [Candidatus Thorarchaeota archaeon]
MKVLIWDDTEGISGIHNPERGFTDDTYKTLTTREINAVISGLEEAGVTEIDIFDGHGMGGNLILDELNPVANYLGGGWMVTLAKIIKTEKLRNYDALLLVGLHAQGGTVDGFIAHTNSSFTALRMNGHPVGEIEQAGWLAGYFGVPLIFVSGDEAAVREATHFFPEIESISVKRKKGKKFECRPVEEVYKEITEKSNKAVSRLEEFEPHTCGEPVTVEILFSLQELAQRLSFIPGYEQKDERTVVYQAEDYLEAFWAYHAFRPIISSITGDFYQRVLQEIREKFSLDGKELRLLFDDIKEDIFSESIAFPEVKF